MKKMQLTLLLVGLLAAVSFDAVAQNFNTTGGNYNATCGGVIRMKAATGEIQGIGAAKATAIPGVVDWNRTANGQTVQPYYYERLVVSGGSKTMSDGIFVVGLACPTPVPGYDSLSTYPFYATNTGGLDFGTGTFTYDGDGSQTIYPTDDPYNHLNVNNEGTVGAGTTVTANDITTGDNFTINTGGELVLNGPDDSNFGDDVTVQGELTTGTGGVTFDGDLTLSGGGDMTTGSGDVAVTGTTNVGDGSEINVGTGDLTFNGPLDLDGDLIATGGPGGSGDVTFGGTTTIGGTGSVNFDDGNNLIVSGSVTNDGDGTNLNFACGSNVTYTNAGAQTIMPTANIDGNRYGNLILLGNGTKSVGTSSYGSDINLCGNFNITGGNLAMKHDAIDGTFRMHDPATTATYAANEEVIGKFERITDGSARSYTFNNTNTIISLGADADNPTSMRLNVLPSTNPNDYDATTDVNRKINLTYAGNAGDFEMTVRAAYRNDEGPNAWAAPYTQASLRFYEADASDREKVGTGEVYDRVDAGVNLGYLELAGIGNTATGAVPNGIGLFASGNDLLLAAGPTTFYSVQDGRWTNPNTWDEGTIPTQIDNVEIRTMVYAGIAGPFAGTLAAGNTTPEHTHYSGNDPAANTITIANLNGAAFLLGNEDNPAGYVFRTAQTTGNTFINSNANAMLPAFGSGIAAKATHVVANPGFNGVWITPYAALNSSVILGTNQVQNTVGTFNNEGIIEVGQE